MSKQPTPFQSLYRLTVMVGALVVGSMAAYRYGPPPERLASMIDSTVERIEEMREQYTETKPAPDAGLSESRLAGASAPEAAPAWGTAPPSPPPLGQASSPAPSGGEGVVVEPIGESGLAYRATGSAAGPGGLVRRFDAIAETPEKAELAVLNKMGAARRGG